MPFRYLRDPLFMFCLALYALNRWILKPHFAWPFLHNSLNDVICIPFWLPLMLLSMRKSGARNNDAPPRAIEIVIPLLMWSWVFEIWLPNVAAFKGKAIADYHDILAYAIGAALSSLFWNWFYRPRKPVATVALDEN